MVNLGTQCARTDSYDLFPSSEIKDAYESNTAFIG